MYQLDSDPDNDFSEAYFSVVDVETTGLAADEGRMIEFAAYKVHNGKIIDQYSTLLNPGQHIPNFIRNMTGISNEMVYRAPQFKDVSVQIARFLEGSVFVAHNSQFDYSFVKSEMNRARLDFDMPQLCTRKLSSRIFPQLPRKALDQVCHHLGIRISGRHRAYGDARATAHLLIELLEYVREKHEVVSLDELLKFQNIPHRVDRHRNQNVFKAAMKAAPNAPGVYRVYNSDDDIIYVGKAKNLKLRMASYLTENARDAAKVRKMIGQARRLEWESTASELSAFLAELQLIRRHQPRFNSQLVNPRRFPFIKLTTERKFERLDLVYELAEVGRYYGPFESSFIAEQVLFAADKYFKLVKCESDFAEPFDPCLYFYIDRCAAPCRGDVSTETYNAEVEAAEEFLTGSFEKLTGELRMRLDELSKKLEFEDAAVARDLIEVLERTSSRLRLLGGPIGKANFICGWTGANSLELYRVTRGLVFGPVVAGFNELEPSLAFLLNESRVVTDDFVPLRILLNYALKNPHGFFKLDTNGDPREEELANKIKTAANLQG
ncbi:MAG: exonuclease domain-containing protein [Bacteroidetes bacterium]|nr:exonuclease domain-containing protein [Bacteroidota bacterium]